MQEKKDNKKKTNVRVTAPMLVSKETIIRTRLPGRVLDRIKYRALSQGITMEALVRFILTEASRDLPEPFRSPTVKDWKVDPINPDRKL